VHSPFITLLTERPGRRLLKHNSLTLLGGEFKRCRCRFAPTIGSLTPKDPSNTPRHHIEQPHMSLWGKAQGLTCLDGSPVIGIHRFTPYLPPGVIGFSVPWTHVRDDGG
jgi:hypothetical protein